MKAQHNYPRVLPRDLFNESKLLKCLGRIVMFIEDGMAPKNLVYGYTGSNTDPFMVGLVDDGHLKLLGLHFSCSHALLEMKIAYNTKGVWPLLCDYEDVEYKVFTEDGILTQEFLQFLKTFDK